MIDLTIGYTQAEVEELLGTHKKNLLRLNQQFAESGTSATARSIRESENMIRACQHALRKMDPDTYGKPRSRYSRFFAR